MNNFKKLTLEGLSWNVKKQFFSQGINLIVGIILIRLLSPKDFGLVAMVLVIGAFAMVLRNLGLNQAVIQSKENNENIISTAFWLQVCSGFLISIIIYLAAPYIASFYNEPLIKTIVVFFSIEFLIGTFGLIQFARVQKELNYRRLFYIDIFSNVLSGVTAIVMAMYGLNYWSLVAKSLIFTTTNTVLIWMISEWRPIFVLDFKITKRLFNYSLPVFGNQLLNYGVRNIDDLLIGKVLGQQALGLYNRSYSLMLMPLKNISRVIADVLFPSFSKIQDDPARIKQIYLKVINVVALITFPLMIGLYVLVEPFVLIVLGEQWLEIIPVIRILSILGMAQCIGMFNGVVFLSLGKTKALFKIEAFSKSFMILMIIIGVYYTRNIAGVALFYAIASGVAVFPAWYFMGKLIGTSILEIFSTLFSVTIIAILMGLFLVVINNFFFTDESTIITLLIQILLGVFFYVCLLAIFRINAYTNLKDILSNKN